MWKDRKRNRKKNGKTEKGRKRKCGKIERKTGRKMKNG